MLSMVNNNLDNSQIIWQVKGRQQEVITRCDSVILPKTGVNREQKQNFKIKTEIIKTNNHDYVSVKN